MTAARAAGVAASLVALAGALVLGACRSRTAAAAPPQGEEPPLAVVPATLSPASARSRPAAAGSERRASVPPGVLSRAAEARALERGPVCPPAPPAAPTDPKGCGPEPHATVEIEWDVAREP
jgi:hypothetical protein